MPNIINLRIPPILNRHNNLINDSRNPCTETEIEDAGEAVDVGGDYTNNLITQTKAHGSGDCGWDPYFILHYNIAIQNAVG